MLPSFEIGFSRPIGAVRCESPGLIWPVGSSRVVDPRVRQNLLTTPGCLSMIGAMRLSMIGTNGTAAVAQRRSQRLEQILTAAWDIAEESGLAAVSLHEVARRV